MNLSTVAALETAMVYVAIKYNPTCGQKIHYIIDFFPHLLNIFVDSYGRFLKYTTVPPQSLVVLFHFIHIRKLSENVHEYGKSECSLWTEDSYHVHEQI